MAVISRKHCSSSIPSKIMKYSSRPTIVFGMKNCFKSLLHISLKISVNVLFGSCSPFVGPLNIIRRENPDVILSLGSEIAIPFFFWAKVFQIKSIYIESWCHIKVLSRTGRIVYWLANEFWVQWPQLLEVCGSKAQYHGAVI